MATTTTVYPDADHVHPLELTQPLPVDGSDYEQPRILAVDSAGYQGGDQAAAAENVSALMLPEVEELGSAVSALSVVGETLNNYPDYTETEGFSTTLVMACPITLEAGDLIEVISTSQESSDAGTPGISGLGLSWSTRTAYWSGGSFRPRFTKHWAIAAGGESGNITLTWGGSIRPDGKVRVWRGVDTAQPYGSNATATVSSGSFPNPAAYTVAADDAGGLVVVDIAGNRTAGHQTLVVPAGWTTISNTTLSDPQARKIKVGFYQADVAAGVIDPAATTGWDSDSEATLTDLIRPGETTEVPVLVAVAFHDETASAELVDGDVALSAVNEVQRLTSFLDGARDLTFSGQTAAGVAEDATAGAVQSALEALSNIAPGDVVVTGGPLGTAPVNIEFTATYAETDVPTITVSGSNTDPVNEVQSLQSDRTGGSFVLSFGGDDTASIPFNPAASQVKAALEALPSIGTGNVECTGGPLPGTAILIEFVGDLAGADQATIGVTDSGTGGSAGVTVTPITTGVAGAGMVVETVTIGSAGEDFALVDSWNTPPASSAQPQIHLFYLLVAGYVAGKGVTVRVADHDGLRSWAALLMIPDRVPTDTPVEATGPGSAGNGTTASYGTVTPSTNGAVVLGLLAKGRTFGSYSGTPPAGSTPGGWSQAALAVADSMTLLATLSPPVGADSTGPGSSSWTGTEVWATALAALAPVVGSAAGSDLYPVLADDSTDTWVEIAPAAGSMFEILEFDLDGIDAAAVLTGALIQFAHASSVANQLRVALVGIEQDGTVHLAQEQQVGYAPDTGGVVTEVTTNYFTELADGTLLNDYPRLGVALISSSRHPALSSHRLFWVRGTVRYEEGGPVVSNATGPTDEGDPITWDYSSAGGFPQSAYEVLVIQGSAQDPDTATAPVEPLNPATGELVYSSGRVPGPLVRSLTLALAPLSRGTCTVAVRAWSWITNSLQVASEWSTADFDISGSPATTPDQSGTDPVYDPDTGAVDLVVVAPAGVSRAWLQRSIDGGTTWELAEGGPFEVTPSVSNPVADIYAPGAESVTYEVAFDNGPMSEVSTPDQVGSSPADTTPAGWVLVVPADTSFTTTVEVIDEGRDTPMDSVVALEPDGALVAVSAALGATRPMVFRARTAGERTNLEGWLESGLTGRLVSILGEARYYRPVGGYQRQMARWRDPATNRWKDVHEYRVTLQQVSP